MEHFHHCDKKVFNLEEHLSDISDIYQMYLLEVMMLIFNVIILIMFPETIRHSLILES